jgi:uncharacterized protein (DUF305 family)
MAETIGSGGWSPSSTASPAVAARWLRLLVCGAAVLTILLLGAALGMSLRFVGGVSAVPEGGTVDVGFAQDMSVHHRQAVLMAALARERSTDPAIRSIAFDIETNQLEQIGQMQGWLSLWNAAPLPPAGT